MRRAKTEGEAHLELTEWAEKHAQNRQVQRTLWQSQAKADLAGQMFVRDVELVAGEDIIELARPAPTFLNLPFPDAIEFAQARGLMGNEGIADLVANYQARGGEGADLFMRELQRRTERGLRSFIESGGTMRDFIDGLQAQSIELGFEPRNRFYLETVFRTSVQSAYGAGRFRQLMNPEVQAARPFVEYRTVGDDRVRLEHAVLDRAVFRIDDPTWHEIAPPNGYNCRCSVVSLSAEQAGRRQPLDSVPDTEIDSRFRQSPIAAVETPIAA